MTTFPKLHIDDLATLSASGAYTLTDGQVEVPVRYRICSDIIYLNMNIKN